MQKRSLKKEAMTVKETTGIRPDLYFVSMERVFMCPGTRCGIICMWKVKYCRMIRTLRQKRNAYSEKPMQTDDAGKRLLQKVLEKNWKKLCYANLVQSGAGNMEVEIPAIFHMEKA